MSKIKFNKEWYRDNKVVIHCKYRIDAIRLIGELSKEFDKIGIKDFYNETLNRYDRYLSNTCYSYEQEEGNISFGDVNYYIDNNYSVINFSDLEFESEYELNEDDLGYEEFDNSFNNLEDIISDIPPKKSVKFKATVVKPNQPIVETDIQNKKTILRGKVKLNNGDIIHVKYKELYENGLTGIITSNGILYTDGLFDLIDRIQSAIIDEELEWYIPSKDIKDELLLSVSQFLFKGVLDDELKELIIYVEDNKPKKRTVETFEVKFCRNSIVVKSPYISDEDIKIGDVISPTDGFLTDRYGIVTDIKCKELTEEELNKYAKITKIK